MYGWKYSAEEIENCESSCRFLKMVKMNRGERKSGEIAEPAKFGGSESKNCKNDDV